MTIKDVAIHAGVSISTVSRVVNGKEEKCASHEVRQRIWQAVNELGYVPNKSAIELKQIEKNKVESGRIFIYLARLKTDRVNSYFEELSEKVKEECLAQGMKIGKVIKGDETAEFLKQKIQISKNDGLIVLGKHDVVPREFLSLFSKRVTYIALNNVELNFDQVMCDGKEATEVAMKTLYENNHRRIAYVGEIIDEIRYVAYKNFLISKNIEMPRDYAIGTTMTEKGGLVGVAKFLEIRNRPTAIFCANDVTAIGVIKALRLSGIKVPEEVSVISIDNIKAVEKEMPILTTVEIPLKELGSCAVKVLCDRINGGHKVRMKVILPVTLIKRTSVKSAKL